MADQGDPVEDDLFADLYVLYSFVSVSVLDLSSN